MATGRTGTAVITRRKIHRHGPGAESYSILHVMRASRALALRADLMAGPARPALGVFVDMDEMEVFALVPEICRLFCFSFREGFLCVAIEAQGITAVRIGGVERGCVILHQKTPIIRSVRIMTSRAGFSSERYQRVFISIDKGLNIFQFSCFSVHFPVMAANAEVGLSTGQ